MTDDISEACSGSRLDAMAHARRTAPPLPNPSPARGKGLGAGPTYRVNSGSFFFTATFFRVTYSGRPST